MKSLLCAFFIVFIISMNSLQSQNSVLSEGEWYKLAVEQTGIHQIGYDDLVSYGIVPEQINPKHIQLFGNGNGILPEPNSAYRYNNLMENAIYIDGEDDESFDQEDYVLFYGEDPINWILNEETGKFEHQVNYYSDSTYYFLTIGTEQGKRIENIPEPLGNPMQTITHFDAYYTYESETYNLIKSGKVWYGEKFEDNTIHDFDLNLAELVTDIPVHLRSSFAVRSFENSIMEISSDGMPLSSVVLTSVNPNSTKYAQKKSDTVSFTATTPGFNLSYTFNQTADSSIAWLDYFEINYKKNILFEDIQFNFREVSSVGAGNITMFKVNNADSSTWVWDVTDPINISGIDGMVFGSEYEFKIETESLMEFVAFKGIEFPNPEFIGQIENQNLHGYAPVDFIIVSPPEFMVAAEQLGQFHESNDGFTWLAVTPDQIYNEFSSGAPDVTAIRDFIRYMYLQSEEQSPQYLLLFGDGSYDPKDRIENNGNFVPTFQTKESLIAASSYVVDDYFGLLDEDEGNDAIGNIDIGIGRIPIKTNSEATVAVSKIINYATNNNTFGDWKNDVCFVADDGDGNLHLEQADSLVTFSAEYNMNKLYFDFFELVQTPEGYIYPDAKVELNQQIENGIFYINYTGHGSVNGWAAEKVLEIEDIQNWNNTNNLPFMVAASCEFTRFDDPGFVSGAELAVLNNQGGVIGLFGCSRLAYSQSNFQVNQRITSYFSNPEIKIKRLGDLIKQSKPQGALTARNIALLGDPALELSIPVNKIITETINGVNINLPIDTINPGEEILITGFITDFDGNQITDFSGDLLIRVFDRPYVKTTLANQNSSYPVDIIMQDSILIEMQTAVQNGEFETSFNMPYLMNEDYGKIKISYYAWNEAVDASGNYSDIIVGGEPNAINNTQQNYDFSMFPTIASTQLNLINNGNPGDIQTRIIDLSGRTVQEKKFENIHKNSKVNLNISKLASGFYVLLIDSGIGVSEYKFIKE